MERGRRRERVDCRGQGGREVGESACRLDGGIRG